MPTDAVSLAGMRETWGRRVVLVYACIGGPGAAACTRPVCMRGDYLG